MRTIFYSFKRIILIGLIFALPGGFEYTYGQSFAYTKSFSKLDRNHSGKLTTREFKSYVFFDFDRNRDNQLSRTEFRRLKRYYARYERKAQKMYLQYYKYALTPLIQRPSYKSHYEELVRVNQPN